MSARADRWEKATEAAEDEAAEASQRGRTG